MEPPEVRSRILREATRLFGARGYGATSVREVVDAAGVTKPTLYYWFANKEALFREAVAAQLDAEALLIERHLRGDGPPLARVRAFVAAYIAQAASDREGVVLLMTSMHPPGVAAGEQPDVDLISAHRNTLGAVMEVLAAAVASGEARADVDLGAAAVALIGGAHLYIGATLFGLPVPADGADRLIDVLFHGVLP